MRKFLQVFGLDLLLVLVALSVPARADVFGAVKGVVHDPQHRPVPGATVTLKAQRADWARTAITDLQGEFQFTTVPVGEYAVSVTLQGFAPATERATVGSGAASELHIQLQIAAVSQSVAVSAAPQDVRPQSATPTSLISRDDIAAAPGADRTNSLAVITNFVPGAFLTHDQLHLRGGHQVSWLVDGVPVPNTNIASNVGPQFDPKDMDYLEVQRGGYGAENGDRTYGVFNVIPRNGFERKNEAELVASVGTFRQTNNQFNFGSHTDRFAHYASVSGNRSDLGLETPTSSVLHDNQNGISGFGSLIFNAGASNQLRLVTSVRKDVYQIPNSPDDQAAGISDIQRETDALVNVSWVRSFSGSTVLTVSPFYHYNAARYLGGQDDVPISTTDERASTYGGLQATVAKETRRSGFEAGFYGFRQSDNHVFGLRFNDGSRQNFTDREHPSGNLATAFMQERLTVASWLTLTAGVRQTHFAGGLSENATSPRVGASLQIPSLGWVVRGFYGRYYQSPPLLTAAGPLLAFVTSANLGFIPLRGERDREYEAGVAIPVRGWMLDTGVFRTRATNFFDHNNVGNSNVFFPLTIEGATLRGWELTIRSPRAWNRAQFHLAYSNQRAEGHGSISGGLTDFEPGSDESFPLDHDQRHTLSAGVVATIAPGLVASGNVSYGSGFVKDAGPDHLPGHATIDLSLTRSFGARVSASVSALNLANRHLLIDSSTTFGGVHFNSPREILGEIRWRFHY